VIPRQSGALEWLLVSSSAVITPAATAPPATPQIHQWLDSFDESAARAGARVAWSVGIAAGVSGLGAASASAAVVAGGAGATASGAASGADGAAVVAVVAVGGLLAFPGGVTAGAAAFAFATSRSSSCRHLSA
jgi:hypothetical protein